MLRLRSDEQLVGLFRAGHEDAFRVIHDRYHKRLFAYVRQMLPRRQDAEDALQEVFVRAYFGLRAHDRELSLRAWLFRVAHNRCVDELRRPAPPIPEIMDTLRSGVQDPVAEADCRESLRRLITDVRRLPEQQRSALLMRELAGVSYADLAVALGVTVPAVKSLLVRARVGLARAAEARDAACSDIRAELAGAHDQGVRPNALARRHMHDCSGCRNFRRELRGVSREFAALVPGAGPLAILTKVLGLGGSGTGSTGGAGVLGSAGGGTASAVGGALGASGTASTAGIALGANHLAALVAAAVATGGAVEIQHTISAPAHPASPAASARTHDATSARPTAAVVLDTTAGPVTVSAGSPPAPAGALTGSAAAGPQRPGHGGKHGAGSLNGSGGSASETPAQSATGATPPATATPTSSSSSSGALTGTGSTSLLGTTGVSSGGGSGSTGSSDQPSSGSTSGSQPSSSGASPSNGSASSSSASTGSSSSTSPSSSTSSTSGTGSSSSSSPSSSSTGSSSSAPSSGSSTSSSGTAATTTK